MLLQLIVLKGIAPYTGRESALKGDRTSAASRRTSSKQHALTLAGTGLGLNKVLLTVN